VDGEITWDPWKALVNERKHGVSFREAETSLLDPMAVTITDRAHSLFDPRFVCLGMSLRNRLLVVVHADDGDTVRIISARRATSPERRTYEEA
jgi:uncharacterized DUF497 family protein